MRVSGAAGATGAFDLRTRDTAGGLSGRVTKAGTGEPRHDATVTVFNSSFFFGSSTKTAADGSYLVGGLSAGDWFVRASAPALITEMWDDRQCAPCDFETGDPIAVAGALVEGIDLALSPGGWITGRVVEADGGTAIPFESIVVHSATGDHVRSTSTDSLGDYSASGLPTGSYMVRTSTFAYADELYDDLPCDPTCTMTAGTPVPVSAGSTSEGIDFALRRKGSIRGTVRRASDGQPLSFAGFVQLYDSNGGFADSAGIGFDGGYLVDALAAGSYFARAFVSGFVSEVYSGLLCTGVCDVTAGTPIPVELGIETAGIDFLLNEGGRIEGTLLAGDTLEPLFADVHLYDGTGNFLDGTFASSGSYLFAGLGPGTYFLHAISWGDSSYEDQIYRDRGCDPSCTITEGDAVAVEIDTTTSGIDFLLARCSASSFLHLTSFNLFGSQTHDACRTIRVGPNATVGSTGRLVLRAGRSVVFHNGFKVSAGGRLEVRIDPAIGSS